MAPFEARFSEQEHTESRRDWETFAVHTFQVLFELPVMLPVAAFRCPVSDSCIFIAVSLYCCKTERRVEDLDHLNEQDQERNVQ